MAYPFQPMNSKVLRILSELMKSSMVDKTSPIVDIDSIPPDAITPVTNHPPLDLNCNHPQEESS